MVVIFTDLDGSLLHRDTFKFDSIKDYIKSLINSGIIIITNLTCKIQHPKLDKKYTLWKDLIKPKNRFIKKSLSN